MTRLDSQHIVVTGAARGIGRAIAAMAAAEGATVGCVDRDLEGAQTTAESLSRKGSRVYAVACDITDFDQVTECLNRCTANAGPVNGLAANAGGLQGGQTSFIELTPEAWTTMLNRNLTGPFHCGLVFARHMLAQGSGSMVFTASMLSEIAQPNMAHYATAKGGLRQLVKSMALELAPQIRVNAIAPGVVLTEGNRAHVAEPENLKEYERKIPLGRVADPEEMAKTVAFLLSEDASYTTGSIVMLDGGFSIA